MGDSNQTIIQLSVYRRVVQGPRGGLLWYLQGLGPGGQWCVCMQKGSDGLRGRDTALEAMAAYDPNWAKDRWPDGGHGGTVIHPITTLQDSTS